MFLGGVGTVLNTEELMLRDSRVNWMFYRKPLDLNKFALWLASLFWLSALTTHRLIFERTHGYICRNRSGGTNSDCLIWFSLSDFISTTTKQSNKSSSGQTINFFHGRKRISFCRSRWLWNHLQLYIFQTTFQLRALSFDIPAAGRVFLLIILSIETSRRK